MPVESSYIQGAKVWIPRDEGGYEAALILHNYEDGRAQLVVRPDSREEQRVLPIGPRNPLPPLCLPQDQQLDRGGDLTSLSVVHEATVLNALRARFHQRHFYSYGGNVTVAFNPYRRLPPIGADEIAKYHLHQATEHHIFSVAQKAYSNLSREARNQSIVFSGITGSGKTGNTRLSLLYLTSIALKSVDIKNKILAALTLTEAFGNAKTVKNDNSSRFGKYFELEYNHDYHVIGAHLKTYLLTRTRIVSQPEEEQNFHIFYQLCAGQLRLNFLEIDEFGCDYLNPPKSDTISNLESFDKTVSALNIFGFSPEIQKEIWLLLAAILQLGNIGFKKLGGPGTSEAIESCLISNVEGFQELVKLFGLDQKAALSLRKLLCNKRVFTTQEEILQPLTVELATKNRDSIARFLYKKLFSWIVAQINVSLGSPEFVLRRLGVLDLYGFENIGTNSFEQLCKNYANEKIQQYCVQSLFKIEQEEYRREDISWKFDQFHDNASCLEFIEGKGGLIDIIDEETKNAQTTRDFSLSWKKHLHSRCARSQHFDPWQGDSADFVIHHFVTSVQYDAHTFFEKNRETHIRELFGALKDSKYKLLSQFMTEEYSRFATAKERIKAFDRGFQKKSVLMSLRSSLATLMEKLTRTQPIFVFCIVLANKDKKPMDFDSAYVLEQLRAFNIIEIVKMSVEGLFKQQSYDYFFSRYYCLLPHNNNNEKTVERLKENCINIVELYAGFKDFSHIKFGITKLFLREEDVVHLDALLKMKQHRAAIVIQKTVKLYMEMRRYWQLRRATIWVQNHARRRMQRRRQQEAIRRMRAAIKIQAYFRGYLTRRWYKRFVQSYGVFRMYAAIRVAAIVKRNLQTQVRNAGATLIQSVYRGYVARRRYQRMRGSAVIIQAWYRGCLGRKEAEREKEERKKHNQPVSKVDDLQVKIDRLIQKHLTPEELDEMRQIGDEAHIVQAKNKALNRELFQKIESLKVLREKSPNTFQEIRTHDVPKEMPKEASDNEATQETPRKIEENTTDLPEIQLNEKDSDEESVQSDVTVINKDSLTTDEVISITSEEKQEEDCVYSEIIATSAETITEDTEEIVQIDAIEDVGASAIVYQLSSPEPSILRRRKVCPLPELDLSHEDEENYDEVLQYSTIRANEVFTPCMIQDDNDFEYVKLMQAYNSFDDRSESLRFDLQLGDFEIMKHKMLNRNSEINLTKVTPKKVKSFTDMALDISYQGHEDTTDKNAKKCLGMIQYDLHTTAGLMYHLCIELEPATLLKSIPMMPSTIIFMCIRYLDSLNNSSTLLMLLHSHRKFMEQLMTCYKGVDAAALWLANTHQLLNYLKQYSKIGSYSMEQYQVENTERQREHHLRNMDASYLCTPVQLTAELIFNKTQDLAKERLDKLFLPAVTKNVDIMDAATFDPAIFKEADDKFHDNHMYRLLTELTSWYNACVNGCLSHCVTIQLFEQIFEHASTIILNELLAKSELCNNLKCEHLRGNLITIEGWATNRKLSKANFAFYPVLSALRFLRLLPFSSEQLDDIIASIEHITKKQMLIIINLYQPLFELGKFDKEVIIEKLQAKIQEEEAWDDTVFLNNSERYQLNLPFEYSPIRFDQIKLPEEYGFKTLELI